MSAVCLHNAQQGHDPYADDGRDTLYLQLFRMSLGMQGQVVTPRKRAVAQPAFERLVTRMLAYMAGQLVRARELPRAPDPRALVRLLPSVGPQVCL